LGEAEGRLWQQLFDLRARALLELEQARQAKAIGKALEAQLKIIGPAAELQPILGYQDELRELLNVSALALEVDEQEKVTITVAKADGTKCERCWHWEIDIGSHPDHPTICGRCAKAVSPVPK
jgi:isoleucyl-tRNA synthetase